jgi:hypothetical protein
MVTMIKSKRIRWAEHIAYVREKRNPYRVLVEKPHGNNPQERPRRRCVGNVQLNLGEISWDGMGWINQAQDREQCRDLVNVVMSFRFQ